MTPFGRQPMPVRVSLYGPRDDVLRYERVLRHMIENHGDDTEPCSRQLGSFTIYPRAVND